MPVGLLVIQPTRLPQSLQQFEGQSVFLPIAYGTGFVVREDGYVVTALHVVRKAETRLPEIQASGKQVVVCLNTPAGSPECKEVEVVGTDERNDLALLKIKRPKGAENLRALPLTPETPTPDTEVWAAGYPERDAGRLVVASGKFAGGNLPNETLAANDVSNHDRSLWLAEMMVENGESGGPVYLRNGSVIGVMVTRSDTQAIAGIVPAQHVIDLLVRSGVTNRSADNSRNATAGP
ncbi:MAG: serine protease [Acidobacteriia bacterium]|nr:serine protease [Terriglobia bacterium]